MVQLRRGAQYEVDIHPSKQEQLGTWSSTPPSWLPPSSLLLQLRQRRSVAQQRLCTMINQVCTLEVKIKRTTEHRGDFEGSFKVALSRFPEYMNGNDFCIIQILQAHKGLDKEGLSVLHVEMEEGHHGDTKVRAAKLEQIE